MMMDLLYDNCHSGVPKHLVHLHDFMLDVHSRIHVLQRDKSFSADPVPTVAAGIG